MLTEDQIEAMARANWPGIEWDDESLAESAHLREAFRAGVRAVIATHEAKAAPAIAAEKLDALIHAYSDWQGYIEHGSGDYYNQIEEQKHNTYLRLRAELLDAATQAAPAVPQGEPVAWRVSSKDEPELGFWLDEEGPGDDDMGLHYEPLYTTPAAPSQPSKYGSPELQALIVAHAAQSQPVTLTEWISVDKRLPDGEPGDPAIEFYNDDLRNPTRQVIGIYRDGVWYSGGHQFSNVTYWKPLTPAPIDALREKEWK